MKPNARHSVMKFNLHVGLLRRSPVPNLLRVCKELRLVCVIGPGVGFLTRRYPVRITGPRQLLKLVASLIPDLK